MAERDGSDVIWLLEEVRALREIVREANAQLEPNFAPLSGFAYISESPSLTAALTRAMVDSADDTIIHDSDALASYHPHRDPASGAVGWKAIDHKTGRTEYVMLNPSGGSDDGVATVFTYIGETGDPAHDDAIVHHALFESTIELDS